MESERQQEGVTKARTNVQGNVPACLAPTLVSCSLPPSGMPYLFTTLIMTLSRKPEQSKTRIEPAQFD